MLQQGGNAVDAVIAAAAALTVVEPVSNGLGSDAFAIVWDGKTLHGLDASGVAPAAWNPDYFERTHKGEIPSRGVDSITVPGAIAGWDALRKRFGTLPYSELLAPAINYAAGGYAVAPAIQQKWKNQIPILQQQPGFAEVFMPYGRAPNIGERMTMPGAAATLERIALHGASEFYRGETAEKLVGFLAQHGAALSRSDLENYQPEWCGTISKRYRGYDVHEIPPSGQGIAALMALGILEHFDLQQYSPDSIDCRHLQIEAMKLAFADVYRYVGDQRYMQTVNVEALLDGGYLAQRAKLISSARAQNFNAGQPPAGGTIYLTAADANGMLVSYIQSNFMGFGSGVVAPEIGVSLQNRGAGFTMTAGHPNQVAPGKHPFHTIIPGFLMQDGQPRMSFGVMGGSMQPQGHVQTLTRMLDHQQQPQAACDAARWRVHDGTSIDVEAHMQADVISDLTAKGHQIQPVSDSYMDFGSGQFIWRLCDAEDATEAIQTGYVAASDSRRDGYAACC